MAPKYSKQASTKIARVMREFERGVLKSSSGRKVTSRKQAVAIGISEARERGYKVPPEPKRQHSKIRSERSVDDRVRTYLSSLSTGQEIDGYGMARVLRDVDPLAADYALERAAKAGLAVTEDGKWFAPAGSGRGRQHSTRATTADIEREAARGRAAKPSARVTAYPRDRYVDEAHINVTTTRGDLAGSHFAAYAALKKAGIAPARSSAGTIRLTVEEGLPLSKVKALVIATLEDVGIQVDK